MKTIDFESILWTEQEEKLHREEIDFHALVNDVEPGEVMLIPSSDTPLVYGENVRFETEYDTGKPRDIDIAAIVHAALCDTVECETNLCYSGLVINFEKVKARKGDRETGWRSAKLSRERLRALPDREQAMVLSHLFRTDMDNWTPCWGDVVHLPSEGDEADED